MGDSANDGTDNQLYAFFIEACSFRIERRLKSWDPSSKKVQKLISLVSSTKRAECRVMRWAMGEDSVFSKARDYDHQSASRAFSRTVGPLLVFLGFWGFKETCSYAWNSYKDDLAAAELKAKLLIISQESAAKVEEAQSKAKELTDEIKTTLEELNKKILLLAEKNEKNEKKSL